MSYHIHPQDLELPASIGKYQIVGEIGRGGFGMVLKARHEGLNKLVAIKLLHAALVLDPSVRARFELEARAGATLSHPNLVGVFDYGFTDRGEPYLVMEYVEGINLEDYIEKQKPSTNELVPILLQVGKALRYLHESQIVHRDLKTSNILVQRIGDEIYARLLDLGIAKVFAADAGTAGGGTKASPTLTGTGMIFGSPSFMSPEQCQGMPVDARSDVYSFGCVVYQCLTGDLPFRGDNPMVVMLKHLSEEAPVPQVRTPQELELAKVAAKCMLKDREQRYQSVKEVNDALQRIIAMGAGAGNARGMSASRSYMGLERAGKGDHSRAAPSGTGGTARGGAADTTTSGHPESVSRGIGSGGINEGDFGGTSGSSWSSSAVLAFAAATILLCALGYFAFQSMTAKTHEDAAKVPATALESAAGVAPTVPNPTVAAPKLSTAGNAAAPVATNAEAQRLYEQTKRYAEQARAEHLAAEEATKKAEDATRAAEEAKRQTQATAATVPTQNTNWAEQIAAAQARNKALKPLIDERFNMVQAQMNALNQRPANPYDAVGNMAAGNEAMRAQLGRLAPPRNSQSQQYGVSSYPAR